MDWVLYTATLEKYKLCASTFRQQPTQDLILSRRHLTLDNTDKLTALPTGLFTFTVFAAISSAAIFIFSRMWTSGFITNVMSTWFLTWTNLTGPLDHICQKEQSSQMQTGHVCESIFEKEGKPDYPEKNFRSTGKINCQHSTRMKDHTRLGLAFFSSDRQRLNCMRLEQNSLHGNSHYRLNFDPSICLDTLAHAGFSYRRRAFP